MKFISSVLVALLLAACATLESNSRSLQTGERTFTVTGFQSSFRQARELSYLRAALETLNSGYRFFEIVREFGDKEEEVTTTPARYEYEADDEGNEREIYIPPRTSVSTSYTYVLEIRTLTGLEKDEYEKNGFQYNDAQTIYDQLAPKWIPEERERARSNSTGTQTQAQTQ